MNQLILKAVTLALLIAGPSLAAAEKSAGEVVDDTVLQSRVKAALLGKDLMSGVAINIETYKGTVQLGGFVESKDKIASLAAAAAQVEDVKHLDNQLHARPPERSAGQVLDDSLATARIKKALADVDLGEAWKVNIDVYNGVVLLTGFVASKDAKKRAGELAQTDKNTRSVVNGLYVVE